MPQVNGRAGPRVSLELLDDAIDAALGGAGWSRRRLAAHLGLSPSTLTRISQGRRPDADALAVLLAWLRLPAEQLLALDDPARQRIEPVESTARRKHPARDRPARPPGSPRPPESRVRG